MPITKITIENFKGIADKVEIPIRPLTLLFGANSAGKSTVLQALLYMGDVLARQHADADRLLASGATLDLGGFREFVHNRDLSRKVRIGVSVELDDDGLPETRHRFNPAVPEYGLTSHEADGLREVTVNIEVEWSPDHQRPFVTCYSVDLDGIPFAAIHAQPGFEAHLDLINSAHPVFHRNEDGSEAEEATNLYGALYSIFLSKDGAATKEALTDGVPERQRIAMGRSVIPDFALGLPEAWASPPDKAEHEDLWNAAWTFSLLNRTVVGAAKVVMEELKSIRYIGPIRTVPARNFQPRRSPSDDRWADGSAAWDLIGTMEGNPNWLRARDIQNLGLGLSIECFQFFEIPKLSSLGMGIESALHGMGESFFDLDVIPAFDFDRVKEKTRVQLVSDATGLELHPGEVGVGVSQVLPVAIGAMAPGYRILAVEQPELHIHPAIQCNLGDLLAAQAIKYESRTMLLETHSEHLVLRMLRRIREKTEGELPPDGPPLTPGHLSVLWVEQEDGVVRIKPIPVNAQGDFDEQWPKGFFEERANELF